MLQKVDDPFTAATEACRARRGKTRNDATCFSPWAVVSCWFRKGRSRERVNLDQLCGEDEEDDHIELGFLNSESSSNSVLDVSTGIDKRDASLSLGVGIGLLYVMATNNNEMKKLEGLCKQMEAMLQDFRRSGQANNENCTPKARVFSSYPAEHVSIQEYCPSYSDSDFTSSSYQNSHSKLRKRKGKKLEMDQLEAELEAELKNLQLHLDDEVSLNFSQHKHSESEIMVDSESPPEEITCFEGAFERLETENKRHGGGVHPRELERRLHELQQVRQQERIRELEIALQNATNNIDERQREIYWWKDTARIVFQHSPL